MEIVYDFLEGRVTYQTFIDKLYSDESIFNWLQSFVTDEMLMDQSFRCQNSLERNNGSVKDAIGQNLGMGTCTMNAIYQFLYYFLAYALPDKKINRIDYYSKLSLLYLDVVGECYGGPEVEDLINDIIINLPEELSKTKKIKLAKEKMRELFPGKKRPFWIEGPEWPVNNGKPMIYISRKVDGDLFQYIFEDPETGERRIVEQYA